MYVKPSHLYPVADSHPLSEVLKLHLILGRLTGLLPFKTKGNGRYQLHFVCFIPTLIMLGAFSGFTYYYWMLTKRIFDVQRIMSTHPVIRGCLWNAIYGMLWGPWLEVFSVLIKCRKIRELLNNFGTTVVERNVLVRIRNRVLLSTLKIGVLYVAFCGMSVAMAIATNERRQTTFLPIAIVSLTLDIIVCCLVTVPGDFLRELSSQVKEAVYNGHWKSLPKLQAKHGHATDWMEKAAGSCGLVYLVRVSNSFVSGVAAFVLIINGDPLIFNDLQTMASSMSVAILLAFSRLWIVCDLGSRGLVEVCLMLKLLIKPQSWRIYDTTVLASEQFCSLAICSLLGVHI
jgi:hypothetical protein